MNTDELRPPLGTTATAKGLLPTGSTRFLGVSQTLWLVTVLSLMSTGVRADLAPTSLSGKVYYFYVTNCTEAWRIGRFYLATFTSDSLFVMLPDQPGTYTYTKSGPNTATAVASLPDGLRWDFDNFTFDTPTSGTFSYSTSGGDDPPEQGSGTFLDLPTSGDLAPVDIAGKSYLYFISESSQPAALGQSRVSYSATTFHLPMRGPAYPEENGSFTFARTGPSNGTGSMTTTDLPMQGLTRTMQFAFGSPVSGTFTYSASGGPLPDENGSGVFIEYAYPPSITTPPATRTADLGGTVTFGVECTGSPPLKYQWHKNGSPVAGAISPSLVLSNLTAGDSDAYRVTVTNVVGLAVSSEAALTVRERPVPSLSITPALVTTSYSGKIELLIEGVPVGAKLAVERYLDVNENGQIDDQDFVVQGFTLTDGQLPFIGGVRNLNVPGDEDGAIDGQLRTELQFPGVEPISGGMVGRFLFRMHGLDVPFEPATNTFEVRQVVLAQGVSGRVTDSTTGLPVGRSAVAMLPPYGRRGTMALADANGDFTLYGEPGEYQLVVAQKGYVGRMEAVTLGAAQVTNRNLILAPAPLSVAGRLSDATSGVGLAGILLTAGTEGGWVSFGFTDAAGRYEAHLLPGRWAMRIDKTSLAGQGYVGFDEPLETNLIASVTGLDVTVFKANALIYGRIADNRGNPVVGVLISNEEANKVFQTEAVSYPPGGDYALGILAAPCEIDFDEDELAHRSYIGPHIQASPLAGQAVRVDPVLRIATAQFTVCVHDTAGQPIRDLQCWAWKSTGGTNYHLGGQTGTDGRCSWPVFEGTWTVGLECDDDDPSDPGLRQRGYVCADDRIVAAAVGGTQVVEFTVRLQPELVAPAFTNISVAPDGGLRAQLQVQTGQSYSVEASPDLIHWRFAFPFHAATNLFSLPTGGPDADKLFLRVRVGRPPYYLMFFALSGQAGAFAGESTASVAHPVHLNLYQVMLQVDNVDATNCPPAANVWFTGPPGSGLSQTPAAAYELPSSPDNFGWYESPTVVYPAGAASGHWTIGYGSTNLTFDSPSPKPTSQLVVPVPSVAVSNGLLQSLSFVFADRQSGAVAARPGWLWEMFIELTGVLGKNLIRVENAGFLRRFLESSAAWFVG